ncbi:hypothetical protein ASE74_15995 [Pedobacter sp. Leaf216]|uniref:hypothetical protein n=1 Tax=Pedobacter sp. Leaf216 TaxID=1735684 RepID=UPI0006FCBA1C|nr:hypothetical protein [Pedobacter sp. Leaf216]KQM77901.1 hypothetical protein ASE74_15995 [Pedobacter sp. Leaf216]
MGKTGTCQLCKKETVLELSHLIPKFIFRWIKETGTGYMRTSDNFNKRIQDGFKDYFLCADCEDLFCEDENYFAKNIFLPVVNRDVAVLEYDHRFYGCVVSIFWRVLKYTILAEEKDQAFYPALCALEKEWRLGLLSQGWNREDNRLHLLSGVDIVTVVAEDPVEVPDKMIQYMGRMVDAGIADSDTKCMLFLKIPRFLFIYQLFGFDGADFISTCIRPEGGYYDRGSAKIADTDVAGFFLGRAKMVEKMFSGMSPGQREKTQKFSDEKRNEVQGKDLGKILGYAQRKSNNN